LSSQREGSFQLSLHLKQPGERCIHELFSGSHGGRCDFVIGAITSFGGGLNRREVLVIAIAIAEKEKLLDAGSFSQAHRVLAEEFA
jgi:hypothetical protein